MERKNNNHNKNVIIVTVAILGLIAVCIGGTYAYFIATATSNPQTITTGTLTATYNTGQDINASNIIPTTEASATEHHFNITNNGSDTAELSLSFTELSLTKGGAGTQSANLKWALYEVSDDSYTVSDSSIAGGDFSNTSSPLSIKDAISINSKETKYYVLRIWLNETGSAQNEDQGMTFSAKIRADME